MIEASSSHGIRAVIFDLDGTLLDTLRDIADSMNMALEKMGRPRRDFTYMRNSIGFGIEELARRVMPEGSSEEDVARSAETMRDIYRKHYRDTSIPYEGIPGLLDELARMKMPFAILSNKPEDFTIKMTRELLPGWDFAAVRGLRKDRPRKPDPAVALEIASGFGFPPERIAFVGDSAVDMETAAAAGMYGVGVLWGFRSKEEIVSAGAKALISHPMELIGILKACENQFRTS